MSSATPSKPIGGMLVTQTYRLTIEERRAISKSFGESDPATYVIVEQFLRDVIRNVLDSLVEEMRAADAPAPTVRVRKRPRPR